MIVFPIRPLLNGAEELSELIFAKLDESTAAQAFSACDVAKDGNLIEVDGMVPQPLSALTALGRL